MTEASIPDNESSRLAALWNTRLLDTPLEERFERITRLVCRLLGVPTASISLVDETRQWFKSVQGSGLTETPRNIAFCAHAILRDEVMLVSDATKDERFQDNPLVTGPEAIKFYAGHPLKSADGCRVGVLCAIDHKPRTFSEEDMQTLRDLAALAEAELNASRFVDTQRELLSQLDAERKRAMTDPLTRLWNREGILEILRREHQRALLGREHLGILIIDLDMLKQVNDTHGHPVGDAVLREVAKRMLGTLRDFDAVGRMGDDEFLIVLPFNINEAKASLLASRLCQRIRHGGIPTAAGTLPITVSVGGAVMSREGGQDVEALIRLADESLYAAKERGRDCYSVTTALPPLLCA